eukprot:2549775-Pleurochrysis_carterae.AAC.1
MLIQVLMLVLIVRGAMRVMIRDQPAPLLILRVGLSAVGLVVVRRPLVADARVRRPRGTPPMHGFMRRSIVGEHVRARAAAILETFAKDLRRVNRERHEDEGYGQGQT